MLALRAYSVEVNSILAITHLRSEDTVRWGYAAIVMVECFVLCNCVGRWNRGWIG